MKSDIVLIPHDGFCSVIAVTLVPDGTLAGVLSSMLLKTSDLYPHQS